VHLLLVRQVPTRLQCVQETCCYCRPRLMAGKGMLQRCSEVYWVSTVMQGLQTGAVRGEHDGFRGRFDPGK
jgi:hypothetical protein